MYIYIYIYMYVYICIALYVACLALKTKFFNDTKMKHYYHINIISKETI